jgi:hypothetical protein
MFSILGFDLGVKLPNPVLEAICQMVHASDMFLIRANQLATGVLLVTDWGLRYTPSIIASVCVQLTCLWSDWHVSSSGGGYLRWTGGGGKEREERRREGEKEGGEKEGRGEGGNGNRRGGEEGREVEEGGKEEGRMRERETEGAREMLSVKSTNFLCKSDCARLKHAPPILN